MRRLAGLATFFLGALALWFAAAHTGAVRASLAALGAPLRMPANDELLPGRKDAMKLPATHFVTGRPFAGPVPAGAEVAYFSMGCFWGAEKRFWNVPGVLETAVGYAGGGTPNPTYEEVSSGRTGHSETVRVVYDPAKVPYASLLKVFWEGHDPTQGMRQGADVGTQYRSAILWTTDAQRDAAILSREQYQAALKLAGKGTITTQVDKARDFYFAEAYHQQYLAKNPDGYCGHGGTGVACPVGLGVPAASAPPAKS